MDQTTVGRQEIKTEKRILLEAKAFARENRTQSWVHLWVVVLCISSCYTILFVFQNLLVLFMAGLLLSLLLVRFFVIYHDYVHKTILQKSIVAEIIFTLFGLYILAPIGTWNRSHNHHHQHNSKLNVAGIGSFPIQTKEVYLSLSPAKRFAYLSVRHPVTILLAYFFTFMYGMCLQNVLKNLRRSYESLIALLLHAGIGTFLFLHGGPNLLVFAFLMPALISGCLGSYLFYVQHNYPTVCHHQNENWSYFKAAMNSSGYVGMNPVMEWFTANIGYHHIHHLNPAIPFYNLPKAYNAIPAFKIEKDISLNPSDVLKCLRLKVWDTAANKMIGLNEL